MTSNTQHQVALKPTVWRKVANDPTENPMLIDDEDGIAAASAKPADDQQPVAGKNVTNGSGKGTHPVNDAARLGP